ncbi:hypothetical protein BO71DRAFT_163550 [Aspergillus ellipticus CBS 707.79]|uniref:Uncharacterized protein n=1 Tax=Aspergillus ellipticus CBS 707.79 TaxID=1448320 RepID=A0A319DH73_9EURO|nr:hypothetical protein BO71DRAFT_163550 [Aspergillus ellipticus CBS 707.79]
MVKGEMMDVTKYLRAMLGGFWRGRRWDAGRCSWRRRMLINGGAQNVTLAATVGLSTSTFADAMESLFRTYRSLLRQPSVLSKSVAPPGCLSLPNPSFHGGVAYRGYPKLCLHLLYILPASLHKKDY